MNFLSFNFPLREHFFLYFARLPPLPISFLMVCPLYSILHSPIQLSIQQFQPFIQHSTLIFKTFNYSLDCLQSTFSLKIRLNLDLIPRDCKPRCYFIGIETRREKTGCGLFCSKQTLRQPRNGVTDWSIAQLLTDH